MNLDELEGSAISKKNKGEEKISQASEPVSRPIANERKEVVSGVRRYEDWMLILKLSVILATMVGILLGGVCGFFIGKAIYQDPTQTVSPGTTDSTQDNPLYSQFKYEDMYINKSKNVTIESFYADDEERFFAMQFIGTKLPELKYLDSADVEKTTKDLGDGKYIIEFVEPDCAFCNKMISVVNSYRETENALQVLGLSIKDGNISAFNTKGENTYMLINKDKDTEELVGMVVWVPTFLYVENGEVKHVTFGLMDDAEEIQKNIDIAFDQ